MLHFSDGDFAEKLAENSVVMADFSATWCGPCKALSPIIEELAQEYESKVLIGKVDVDDCPELSEKYEIMSVPTVILFKDGQMVQKTVGSQPKSVYVSLIEEVI